MNELCVTNTLFKKKTYATKYCTLNNDFYTIDFILTRQKGRKYLTNSGVAKKIINSDHRAIYMKFNINYAIKERTHITSKTITKPKVNLTNLRDTDKANHYISKAATSFRKEHLLLISLINTSLLN